MTHWGNSFKCVNLREVLFLFFFIKKKPSESIRVFVGELAGACVKNNGTVFARLGLCLGRGAKL